MLVCGNSGTLEAHQNLSTELHATTCSLKVRRNWIGLSRLLRRWHVDGYGGPSRLIFGNVEKTRSFEILSLLNKCLYRQSLESRNRPPHWSTHQCLFKSLEGFFACSRSSKSDPDTLYLPVLISSLGDEGRGRKASCYIPTTSN